MSEICTNCAQPVDKEMAVALREGYSHWACPPPVVEFHPGKGKDRYYLIDGARYVRGLEVVSVTTILKEIGDKFGQAAWWGQGVGAAAVAELIARGELLVEEG